MLNLVFPVAKYSFSSLYSRCVWTKSTAGVSNILLYSHLCPSSPPLCPSISLLNMSDVLDCSQTRQGEQVKKGGQSPWRKHSCWNLMPSTAAMPDTRCASHFVRSPELLPPDPVWKPFTHACGFAPSTCIKVRSATLRGSSKSDRCTALHQHKDRQEGGLRNEFERGFSVPVTWLECGAPRTNGSVIRSGADRGFPVFRRTATQGFTRGHSPHWILG